MWFSVVRPVLPGALEDGLKISHNSGVGNATVVLLSTREAGIIL